MYTVLTAITATSLSEGSEMNRDSEPDRPPADQQVVVDREGPADTQGVVEVVHRAIAMFGHDADLVTEIRRVDSPESGDPS